MILPELMGRACVSGKSLGPKGPVRDQGPAGSITMLEINPSEPELHSVVSDVRGK